MSSEQQDGEREGGQIQTQGINSQCSSTKLKTLNSMLFFVAASASLLDFIKTLSTTKNNISNTRLLVVVLVSGGTNLFDELDH